MTIVEHIAPRSAIDSSLETYRRETITLSWEDRRQGHGKRRSDEGTEFAISLPSGTILKAEDCFVLDHEKKVIEVKAAEEPVYIVRPGSPQEWAYYAYHVGNRHQQVMIGAEELIFLQSPAIRSLLEQLRVPFTADNRPFTAALANVGHAH